MASGPNEDKNKRIEQLWGKDPAVSFAAPAKALNFLDKRLLRKHKIRRSKRQIAVFAGLICFVLLAVQGARIIAAGLNIKNDLLDNAQNGIFYLNKAQKAFQEKNYNTAQEQFDFAKQRFASAQQGLDDFGALLGILVKSTARGNAADRLISAGGNIAAAGIDFNNFRALISAVRANAGGFSSPDGFYGTVNAAKKYLLKASEELSAAREALKDIDVKTLPEDQQQAYFAQYPNLELADNLFAQCYKLLDLFHRFIGPGPKTILVLFENNAELRPSGGFIGTYGMFKFDNGKIASQKISSVYDLDGQINERIAPPGQFYELTDRWGLRDSNWFADFRNSAKKASDFYEMVGKETPDAVIAITPDLFVDLLKITGPITMQKYGLILSADNFRKLIQQNTRESFDSGNSSPKQLLADFAPEFLQSLSQLPEGRGFDLLSALVLQLRQKNILFYDRDPQLQQGFADYNWGGEVLASSADYLQIVNANLGGKKTDLDISQKVNLKTAFQANGDIVNTITYQRSQALNLAQPDKNIVYSRFYVPKGSKLLSASGFSEKPFYNSDGSAYNFGQSAEFKTDKDLSAIDKTVKIHPLSATAIGEESGKTFFGNWIETIPGQTATVVLKYALPFKAAAEQFSLLLQKQPGASGVDFEYAIDLPRAVRWYTPENLKFSGNQLNYSFSLGADKFIGFVFKDKNGN